MERVWILWVLRMEGELMGEDVRSSLHCYPWQLHNVEFQQRFSAHVGQCLAEASSPNTVHSHADCH